MSLNLIITDSLNNADIAHQIAGKLSNKQYLHLCATKNIKDNRLNTPCLSITQKDYSSGYKPFNLATFAEFGSYLQKEAFKDNKCIRVSDERYILKEIIDSSFDDETKKNVFHSMRFQIYDLYQFLMFYDVNIMDSTLEKIGADYSEFERDVFALYTLFFQVINTITTGKSDDNIAKFLGDVDFSTENYVTVRNSIKKILKSTVESCDVIIFDGFLFFNDLQQTLIKCALEQNKEVYLTAKYTKGLSYLLDTVYPTLYTNLNLVYIRPIVKEEDVESKTALQFIQNTYGDFKLKASDELLRDESIQFIKPFPNREMEWRYIAEQISQVLRENCGNDINKLQDMLKNDIAIVLAHYGYNEQLAAVLKDVGLFVFIEERSLDCMSEKVLKTFDSIYFSREDFLSENIQYESGTKLSYADKVKLFDKAFKGIKIKKEKPPIIAYPVGQYVFKIYDILLNGIGINTFKILLYSNWQYNVQANTVKWDKYLHDFKTLEVFFENENGLDEWISIVKNLIALKKNTGEDYLLKHHPLKVVNRESLLFFLDIFVFIKDLVIKVGSINGSIEEHLRVLKHTVMTVDKFVLTEDASFEQSIIMELIQAVDRITASSLIKNVPATYFAENLHSMLNDFESNIEEDNGTDEMYINLITLENITHFKYCFLPLFESNKYPRKYFESFPFNREIIEILSNSRYGISCVPADYKDLTSHIILEENLFKNVLDFTEERLILTMTHKEDEHKNYISHYAHDIASMFGSEITWTESCSKDHRDGTLFTGRKLPKLNYPKKEQYTLRELVTYKLCPRLYYHSEHSEIAYISKFQLQFYFVAVLFSATLNEFKTYNLANKKTYQASSDEAFEMINSLFDSVYLKYLPLFNIFTDYELSDIRATVQQKMQNFLADLTEKGIKGSTFTVVSVPEKHIYKGNDYDLILEYDTKIYDMENKINRISQNDIFLDFLVLKTSDNTKEPLKHYADMLEALAQNRPGCDRVNLVFKMMGKINIQFDSKRFAHDGFLRTSALVNEICHNDFSYLKPYVSGFCQYCCINDICKEKMVLK